MAKPSAYFQAKLYTGNGNTNVINGFDFSPDLIWLKSRSQAYHARLFDKVRGVSSILYPALSDAAGANPGINDNLVSIDSDGFTLGSTTSTNGINENGTTFIAHGWKKDPAAGFAIKDFVGTGVAHAENHNCGGVVEFMMVKALQADAHWQCYHHKMDATPQNGSISLNQTWAYSADSSIWNNTAPTSTQFTVGTSAGTNHNGGNMIAYLWRGIKGFSQFGSYQGNGLANGPFIETDFLPALVMIKAVTSGGGNWVMRDSARDTYNPSIRELFPNTASAEYNQPRAIDFVSNGFKLRHSETAENGNGVTYVYAAWAAQPFKYGRAH